MAFSYSVIPAATLPDAGGKKKVYGTFANTSGSTGGEVVTSLSVVEFFCMQHTGASVVASAPVANETFPLTNSTGSVTVVTVADTSGVWYAVGY